MKYPHVSVVISAYNAMPYLVRCVNSVLEQSIGLARLEIVAVDDGSTDGTGEELDRIARLHPEQVRVVHQENSGGPSRPRNVGIDLARGRYVFFLDSDDYLGPEALERLVRMAEANRSDVVLGKMVGVGGRGAPRSMFTRDEPDADLFTSRVYRTLNPMKLFRKELLERHELRFPETWRTGEDQYFVALAYLHATKISVLASYDCVYWVHREDGGNLTRSTRDAANPVRTTGTMLALVTEHVPAGPGRDHLLRRHFQVGVSHALAAIHKEPDAARREELFGRLHEAVAEHYSPSAVAELPAIVRLRCELVRRGLYEAAMTVMQHTKERRRALGSEQRPVPHTLVPAAVTVEDGRVLAHYPFFRDPRLDLPDSTYDISDEVSVRTFVKLASLSAAEDPERPGQLLVTGRRRERMPAIDLRVTATHRGKTIAVAVAGTADGRGFQARLPLPEPGKWRLSLQVPGNSRLSHPLPDIRSRGERSRPGLLGRLGQTVGRSR